MKPTILLGLPVSPRGRSGLGRMLWVWWPVVVMLLVIVRESTDTFSAENTSSFLRPIVQALIGLLNERVWEHLHHVIRKTGHFIGYGLLGLAWLRAWLFTWQRPLRCVSLVRWRGLCWQMAVCCTALVASLDEWHQTYLPSRTGLAVDVLLDTAGAMSLCGCIGLVWLVRAASRGREAVA